MDFIKFQTPESDYNETVEIDVADIKRFGLYWRKCYWKGNGRFRKFLRYAFVIADKRYEIPTDTAIKLRKHFNFIGKLKTRKEEIAEWKKGKKMDKINYYFEII